MWTLSQIILLMCLNNPSLSLNRVWFRHGSWSYLSSWISINGLFHLTQEPNSNQSSQNFSCACSLLLSEDPFVFSLHYIVARSCHIKDLFVVIHLVSRTCSDHDIASRLLASLWQAVRRPPLKMAHTVCTHTGALGVWTPVSCCSSLCTHIDLRHVASTYTRAHTPWHQNTPILSSSTHLAKYRLKEQNQTKHTEGSFRRPQNSS